MLAQLRERVRELNSLADEVFLLAERMSKRDETAQPALAIKGQQWYRGARELLVQQRYSGLKDFDLCYDKDKKVSYMDLGRYLKLDLSEFSPSGVQDAFRLFRTDFLEARALLQALEYEILSRELPVKTELSFEVAATEMDTAQDMLDNAKGAEVFVRASGVIARVALERHLSTVADSRKLPIAKNPPSKKHPDVEDLLQTLQKNGVVTAVQKAQFDSLFKIANNCAHPKEAVVQADVERLVRDGREMAALIV
jgi:hypothetical protein